MLHPPENAGSRAIPQTFVPSGIDSSSHSGASSSMGYGGRSRSHSQSRNAPTQPLVSSHQAVAAPAMTATGSNSGASSSSSSRGGPPSRLTVSTSLAAPLSPAYMAARASPIGPPPRSALPALPSPPVDTSSAAAAAQTSPSGMLAMATSSRPVTALFEGAERYQQADASTSSRQPDPSDEYRQSRAYASQGGGGRPQLAQGPPPTVNGASQASSSGTSTAKRQPSHKSLRSTRHEAGQESLPDLPTRSAARPAHNSIFSGSSPPVYRNAGHAESPSASPSLSEVATARSRTRSLTGPDSSDIPIDHHINDPDGRYATVPVDTKGLQSKAVLAIALRKAQSAVVLDGEENAEDAMIAYTLSLELLQEVMDRVEESAGQWRDREMEKLASMKQRREERRRIAQMQHSSNPAHLVSGGGLSAAAVYDYETEDERREREKREAKFAKRERMRQDECRKLKVIHDTYVERVQSLRETIDNRKRLETLSLGGNSQRNSVDTARTADLPLTPSARNRYGATDSAVKRSEDSARVGIGSAMLANSPLSPSFPASSAISPPDSHVKTSAVPFPQPSPTSVPRALTRQSAVNASPPSLTLPDIKPLSFSPASSLNESSGQRKQEDENQSMLSFSPDSDHLDHGVFSGHTRQSSGASASRHKRNASSASYNKALPAIEGLATFGDLAKQYSPKSDHNKRFSATQKTFVGSEDAYAAEGLATPTPDNVYSAGFASNQQPAGFERLDERRSPPTQSSATHSRTGSRASTHALRHMTSNESLASTTTSASSYRDHVNAAGKMPLPPMPVPTAAVSSLIQTGKQVSPPLAADTTSANGQQSGLVSARPLRSASLAVAGQAPASARGHSPQHSREGNRAQASPNALLINSSTSLGTISQRRKSPNIPEQAVFSPENMPAVGDQRDAAMPQPVGKAGLGLVTNGVNISHPQRRNKAEAETITPSTLRAGGVSPTEAQPFSVAGSLPMRLRALSQPNKRPGLPSFHSDFGQLPPLVPPAPLVAPGMQRADSDPTGSGGTEEASINLNTPVSIDFSNSSIDGLPSTGPGLSIPLGRASSEQTVSTVGPYPLTMPSRTAPSGTTSFLEPETPASPTTFRHVQASVTRSPPQGEYQAPPSDRLRLPYHFLRQIRASILHGAHVTPRLHIPKGLWNQASVKLVHTETKVRMLDLLLNGLEAIERTGDVLLLDGKVKAGNVGSNWDAVNRLSRELESFEGMLDGVQSTLAKKLGYIEQPGGKKGGGSSFGIWSSKLSRSMDRMTKGKNLDAPETYVAAIARLCQSAQILDRHLASLHSSSSLDQTGQHHLSSSPEQRSPLNGTSVASGYKDIPQDRRVYIEARLRRSSDFFSRVICKMLLNDLGIWLDKYSKVAAGWTVD